MNWFVLVVAGLFEVVWAVGLKHTEGFTKLWPSVITLLAMGISFYLLSTVLRTLPIGTAYAVWVGIGAVGTAIAGIVLLNEPATFLKVMSLCLVVGGIIGLKLSSST